MIDIIFNLFHEAVSIFYYEFGILGIALLMFAFALIVKDYKEYLKKTKGSIEE